MVEIVREPNQAVGVNSPQIHGGATESDHDYHFTVEYSASFDPGEMNTIFHEFVRLREQDDVNDDFITARQPRSNTFTPNQLSPRDDTRPGHDGMKIVDRRTHFDMPRDFADTEGGFDPHEEIYGEIWLRSQGNLGSTGFHGSDSGLARTNVGDFNP